MNFPLFLFAFLFKILPILSSSNFSIPSDLIDFTTMTYDQLIDGSVVFVGARNDSGYTFTRLDPTGNFSQMRKVLTGNRTFQKIRKLTNGGFVLTWAENSSNVELKFQIYDENFTELYSSVDWHGYNNLYCYNEVINGANGGFSIIYYDSYPKLYMQSFDSQGNLTLSELNFGVIGSDPYGFVLSNGNIQLYYQGIQTEEILTANQTGKLLTSSRLVFPDITDQRYSHSMGACLMKSGKVFMANLMTYKNYTSVFYTLSFNGKIMVDRKNISTTNVATVYPRCACLDSGNVIVAWGVANSTYYSFYFTIINDAGSITSPDNYVFDTKKDNLFMKSFYDNSFFVGAYDEPSSVINVQFYNVNLTKIYAIESCPPPKTISPDKTQCLIANCSTYFTNGSCQICTNQTTVTTTFTACVNPIINCSSHANNETCLKCMPYTVLSVGKLVCANTIRNCFNYSDDGKCASCFNGKILTIGKNSHAHLKLIIVNYIMIIKHAITV